MEDPWVHEQDRKRPPMTKPIQFTQAEEDDIITLHQAGLGQHAIGHLYGCSFDPIRKVLVKAGEEICRFPGRRPRDLDLLLTHVQQEQIDELLREGATVQRIMEHVLCPVWVLAQHLSLSPWWARCERCRQRLRHCDESLWRYERDGLCGECARKQKP